MSYGLTSVRQHSNLFGSAQLQLSRGVRIEPAKEVGMFILFSGVTWRRVLPSMAAPNMRQNLPFLPFEEASIKTNKNITFQGFYNLMKDIIPVLMWNFSFNLLRNLILTTLVVIS